MLSQQIKAAKGEASRILEESKRKAETLIKEADLEIKDKLFKMKAEFDADTKDTRFEFKKREKRIIQKEENVERKTEQLERRDGDILKKEKSLAKKEEHIEHSEKKYNEVIEEQKRHLEQISGLTAEQAKELLIRAMENEARHEGARPVSYTHLRAHET